MAEISLSKSFAECVDMVAFNFMAEMQASKIPREQLIEAVKARIISRLRGTEPSPFRNKRDRDGAAGSLQQQPAKRRRTEARNATGRSSDDMPAESETDVQSFSNPAAHLREIAEPPRRSCRKTPIASESHPSLGGKGVIADTRPPNLKSVAGVSKILDAPYVTGLMGDFQEALADVEVDLPRGSRYLEDAESSKFATFCFGTMIANFKANLIGVMEYVDTMATEIHISEKLKQPSSGAGLTHDGGDPLPEEFHNLAKLIGMAVKEEAKAGTAVARLYELILLVKISLAESEIERLAKTKRGGALVEEFLRKGNVSRSQGDTNLKLLKKAMLNSLNLDPNWGGLMFCSQTKSGNRSLVPLTGRDTLAKVFEVLKAVDGGLFGHLAALGADFYTRSPHLDGALRDSGADALNTGVPLVIHPSRAGRLPDTSGLQVALDNKISTKTLHKITVQELMGSEWESEMQRPAGVSGFVQVEEVPQSEQESEPGDEEGEDGSSNADTEEESVDAEDE
ncbi:hypothetical protein CSIM01_13859 [Colletotrichum simmondsii]|uniref:Uncharacterized protein n=1 Tax=Colletotrichum simmondsii TaxID=703756 RepID=A0A135THG3_9PEZI|nr:hypothetical protein CSIM01_13859 [Colletotrichum simmondsii]